MNYSKERTQVYDYTMKLVEKDLIRLSSGNVSVRTEDGNFAITPSGILYDVLKPEDIVICDFDGNLVDGGLKPSSEKILHAKVLDSRPGINAVVHTHAVYAIAFSACDTEIPVMCVEILAIGGPIPVAPYICPGKSEVGTKSAEYFKNKPSLKGLLLRNHGMVSVGATLDEAYQVAYKLETGAEIYHRALQIGKEPSVLTPEQVQEVFDIYQKPKAG